MFKHKFAKSYPCYAVKGCPNKAKIFNDNLDNHVLCCLAHRQSLFSLSPGNPKLKQMFSPVNAIAFKHMNIIAEFSYKYLREGIWKIIRKPGRNADLDFVFMTSLFRYVTTEIRLFWYYEKLAHFQAPCLEEVHIPSKILELSHRIVNGAFEFTKDFLLRLFIHPVFKTERQMADTLEFARMFIFNKTRNKENELFMELIERIIGTKHKISLCNLKFQNGSILQMAYAFKSGRILCHMIEPSVIDYVSPESKQMCMNFRFSLNKILKIRFTKFPHIDILDYYRTTGIVLHYMGELKNGIKLLKKAKEFLKSKKDEMKREKYEKKMHKIYFNLALIYFDTGIFLRAERYFIKLDQVDSEKIVSKTCFCRGYILIKRREFSECLKYLKENKNKFKIKEYVELKKYCHYELGNLKKCLQIDYKPKNLNYSAREFQMSLTIITNRIINLSKKIYFYRGALHQTIYRFLTRNRIENDLYRNHMLAAEYYLNLALCYEEYGSDEEAGLSIEKALRIVKRNYTKNNFIYIEILIRATSIYLNLRQLSKARILLIILWRYKQENEYLMKVYYELEMLTGKYLYLTNPINEIKQISYKFYEMAREKIKIYHGCNHPVMISLNIWIGKLYQFDDFELFHQKLNDAYSIVKKLNPRIDFHHFDYRIAYELAAGYFNIRKFDITIKLVKRILEEMKERERKIIEFLSDDSHFNYFRKENYKEYRRKAKKLLSKFYIYNYCANIVNELFSASKRCITHK